MITFPCRIQFCKQRWVIKLGQPSAILGSCPTDADRRKDYQRPILFFFRAKITAEMRRKPTEPTSGKRHCVQLEMAPRRSSKRRRTGSRKETEENINEDDGPKRQEEENKTVNEKAKVVNLEPSSVTKKSPVVVFAHGAGAPSSSDWMIRWKNMLHKALNAVDVVTFDYPYMASGKRRAPPKAEKLVDFHVDIVKKTKTKYPGHPVILAGKSMGSRISCMVAVHEDIDVEAVVCLGYPLKGMNGSLRDDTLLQLLAPVMFVQGSKDSLCPLEKLQDVRKKMMNTTRSDLHVIDGGDHSFKISKKHLLSTGSTQDDAHHIAIQAISSFVYALLDQR